jgi:flagellar motor component MotA
MSYNYEDSEEYQRIKKVIDDALTEAFRPKTKEEYRDQLLNYYSWLINKHTEGLNQAVEGGDLIDHKLDSFYVKDNNNLVVNRTIWPKQPHEFITITWDTKKE